MCKAVYVIILLIFLILKERFPAFCLAFTYPFLVEIGMEYASLICLWTCNQLVSILYVLDHFSTICWKQCKNNGYWSYGAIYVILLSNSGPCVSYAMHWPSRLQGFGEECTYAHKLAHTLTYTFGTVEQMEGQRD